VGEGGVEVGQGGVMWGGVGCRTRRIRVAKSIM
jgi:hypothetical protein